MYWPSGDQAGLFNRRKVSFDTWIRSDPSGFMIHRLSPPPRSEMNAMREPSGEKRGWISQGRPDEICVAGPPVIGMV